MLALPFPAIDPVAISLGPLAVRWYALAYLAGIVLGIARLAAEWPQLGPGAVLVVAGAGPVAMQRRWRPLVAVAFAGWLAGITLWPLVSAGGTSVTVLDVGQGDAVLLRLPKGEGWRLRAQDAAVRLEESVYLGGPGEPRRSLQVVMTGSLRAPRTTVKWGLRRETKSR